MRRIPITLLALMIGACSSSELAEEVLTVPVGDSEIQIAVVSASEPGLRYVVLHDDENTAVEAVRATILRHGGTLVELRHDGSRNITFRLNGGTFHFDPNRIFTSVGAVRTLERWSSDSLGSEVVAAVGAFRDTLLAVLGHEYDGALVAVHNNMNEGYSVFSYAPGGELAAEARFVHIDAAGDSDDFVFTTVESVYNSARDAGFHAVLQFVPAPTDDGSLSAYAALEGLPYVNVEAEHGHLEPQLRMLEHLVRTL